MSSPDLIVVTEVQNVMVEVPVVTVVEVFQPSTVNTIIVESATTLITETQVQPVEVGVPGPQGIPGIGSTLTGIAGAAISAYQLLTMINGLLYPADPTDISHGSSVVGVSTTSGNSGATISFVASGQINGGSFTQSRYYAGLGGNLSTLVQPPGAVWIKSVGIGQTGTELVVRMGPTIFL